MALTTQILCDTYAFSFLFFCLSQPNLVEDLFLNRFLEISFCIYRGFPNSRVRSFFFVSSKHILKMNFSPISVSEMLLSGKLDQAETSRKRTRNPSVNSWTRLFI